MRVGQVWQWVYHWGVRDFDRMTNLAKDYRALLAAHFVLEVPEIVTKQVSTDGTRKYLVRIAGGHEVEVVYIPEETRGTLCVSSQVGCTLTCSFCHTGTQKLVRNLTAEEILSQLLLARDRHRQFFGCTQHLDAGCVNLNLAGGDLGVDKACVARLHPPVDPHHPFGAHLFNLGKGRAVAVGQHLGDAIVIAQIDEQHPAVIAHPMHPARQADLIADIGGFEIIASVAAIGVHGLPLHGGYIGLARYTLPNG